MRIRLLRNIGVKGVMYEAGDVVEVDAETGHYLVELRKLAVVVAAPAAVERAVTQPAETAVSKAQRQPKGKVS